MRSIGRAARVICLAALSTLGVPATSSAVRAPFTFDASLFGCVKGIGPASKSITVTWKNADGDLKGQLSVTSDSFGHWSVPNTECMSRRIEPGDTVKAATTSPSLQRTFAVPLVIGHGARSTDVFKGTAPKNSSVRLDVSRPFYTGPPTTIGTTTVPTNANGSYSVDLTGLAPGYDAIGGDIVRVTWTGASGDVVRTGALFPFVTVQIGAPSVSGVIDRFSVATIVIKKSNGVVRGKGTGVGSAFGAVEVELRKPSGAALYPHSGDVVHGDYAGTTNFTLPNIAISWDLAQDVVTGSCLPNVPYRLGVTTGPGTTTEVSTTDSNGSIQPFDVTSYSDLKSHDTISLDCRRGSGDHVSRTVVIP